jgi:hypothetical protein
MKTVGLAQSVVAMAFASLLGGCGSDYGSDDVASDEDVGQVDQDLNETGVDRPVAASIFRGIAPAGWEHWVVACDPEHRLWLKTEEASRNWQRMARGWSCASPPTVGAWNYSNQWSAVGVYWRDLNNHLIEAWFPSTGHSQVTDMSDYLGIGPITGSPVMVDQANVTGAENQFSILVRLAGTNVMKTLDHYSNAWHVQRVLTINGYSAKGLGTAVPAYGPDASGYGRPMFTMQTSATGHTVFARESITEPYRTWAWGLGDDVVGVPTFIGRYWLSQPVNCLADWGCIAYRNKSNQLRVASLQAGGGDLSGRFVTAPGITLTSSLWASPKRNSYGYARTSSGRLGWFYDWKLIEQKETMVMNSAPSVGVQEDVFYSTGASNGLWQYAGFYDELELNVLAP